MLGVRELFEQEPPAAPRRTRADLMRDVDADYYGYRDDDDGLLLPLEQEAEKEGNLVYLSKSRICVISVFSFTFTVFTTLICSRVVQGIFC